MIIFDCERMRHANCGFFSFCNYLAQALHEEARQNPEYPLSFYMPRKLIGLWGDDYRYMKTNHFLHKHFLYNPNITLWHSCCQLTRYMPLRTRIVQTIHDLNYLYEPVPQEEKQCIIKRIGKHIEKVSQIVAISEWTKKDILNNFDVKDRPVRVIYNGCNVWNGPVEEPKRKPARPFLFSISSMYPKKNFHVLACLLKDNDYELILAGAHNSPEYVRQIYEEAARWQVTDRIHLSGVIPESEKHWYLRHCTAFLFPSIAEGFGLPIIEAMQYGKPVFLSTHTCLPEIGKEYAYYFNYDFDREVMRSEFRKGLDDFYNGHKDPERIKAHALSFSWENTAKQYWEVYKEVINR